MEIYNLSFVGFICIFLIFILFIKNRVADVLTNPILFVLLSHIYFIGFIPIWMKNKLLIELVTLTAFIVFMVSLFLAYWLSRSSILPKEKYAEREVEILKLNANSILYLRLAMFFVILWSLYTTLYNSYVFGGFKYAVLRFYHFQPVNEHIKLLFLFDRVGSKIALCCLCAISFISVRFRKNWIYLFITFLFFIIGVVPAGSRGNIVIGLFVMAAGYFMAYRKIPVSNSLLSKRVFGLLTIFIISFQLYDFMTLNRNVNLIEEPIVFQSLSSETNYTISTNKDSPIVIRYIDKILEQYGSFREYLYGHTFYSIIANPIPRTFWTEKPIAIGKILAINDSNNPETIVSFAASYSGEGWANGGWVGVFFVSIFAGGLTGVLIRFSDVFRNRSDNLLDLFKYVLFFNGSIMFIRGDMLSGWVASIYPIVIFYLVVFLFKNIKSFLVRLSS